MAVDLRARKILIDRYWSRAGWRPEPDRRTPPADLDRARKAGLMFEPAPLPHAETWRRLLAARDGLSPAQVAASFIASLSTRRLDLRSALGSYAVFRHATAHRHLAAARGQCELCGQYDSNDDVDLSLLNFERFKWGGVRHDHPDYAALDLELFLGGDVAAPDPEDVRLLRRLLAAIEGAPPGTTASGLERTLAGLFPSNKAERDTVVAILGHCGVLAAPAHPGHRGRFIPWRDRALPDRHFIDLAYPACWWRRSDGLDQAAVAEWFGPWL